MKYAETVEGWKDERMDERLEASVLQCLESSLNSREGEFLPCDYGCHYPGYIKCLVVIMQFCIILTWEYRSYPFETLCI